ncbi:MAG TPA: sulfite exporter TauE/SafE family protein [Nitrososphaeraceae archaeon]|nr:sulfite exporter TauE/SafE family protein [Nitrososphaeraceae archaeon]
MLENLVLTFVVGVVAGIIGSMLGLGGGIIISPILTLSGYMPSQVASTSLLAVASTGASSTVSYSIKRKICYSIGIRVVAFAVPFTVIGALISSTLDPDEFKIYVAVLLISTSVYLLVRKSIKVERPDNEHKGKLLSNALLYAGSSAAGLISSLFGLGGGIIFVPLLFGLKKLSMQQAVATSQLCILITSISGILTHSVLFQQDYVLAGVIALGAAVGAQLGSFIALRISERLLTILFSFSLVLISVQLILGYVQ